MRSKTRGVHVSDANYKIELFIARDIFRGINDHWGVPLPLTHKHMGVRFRRAHPSRFLVADLGVFGKQMVDGESGVGGDLALVGTFFVVVLVGTFASQVKTWGADFSFIYASTVLSFHFYKVV